MPIRFLLLFATLSAFGVVAENGSSSAASAPQPSARLDLSSAGYNELSAMARRSDKVNFTIDFIDSSRLLLTYNPKKLLTRLPECPPTHDDHFIHAAVLDAHTGQVLRSMDWFSGPFPLGIFPGRRRRRSYRLRQVKPATERGAILCQWTARWITGHGSNSCDTGGKAFYNANGIEQAMNIAMEQETNYYALSYTPANKKYDGKFRRIKVTLANGDKKDHVIHRSGYFAVDPAAPSALSKDAAIGFGLASMQHDAPQSRQLLFEARVVPIGKPFLAMDPRGTHLPATKRKKHESDPVGMEPIEMQRYEVDYAITPSQVHFDSTPDGLEHGAMNFMLASFDGDGTVRTSIARRVKSDLKPDEFQDVMTGGFRLHQQVDVPFAAASLRLGVQDAITGRLGTLETHLPIKAPPGMEQSRTQKLPEIEPD